MIARYCSQCGHPSGTAHGVVCARCGYRDTFDPSSTATATAIRVETADQALNLSPERIVALSILSFGLYFIYWFYLTWKQLESETREEHHPVWHALTLFVPIYGLFRLHNHVSVIKDLATRSGVGTSLSPGWVVVMAMASNVLNVASFAVMNLGAILTLSLISLALAIALVLWAQNTLNQYWRQARVAGLRDARIGVGEVLLSVLGLLLWIGTFMPVE